MNKEQVAIKRKRFPLYKSTRHDCYQPSNYAMLAPGTDNGLVWHNGATGLSNQLMLFRKDPGVFHLFPNSTTVTCSDGSCSVFDCTRACMERGDCVVYSHSPAAGLRVLGGSVHANTSTVDVVDDARDTYKGGCPTHAGYAEYEYEGSVVCLTMVVGELMSQAAAVSLCADQRASLVMIKDEKFFLVLRQLLLERDTFWYSLNNLWVGAEMRRADDEYYWLDGTHLPKFDGTPSISWRIFLPWGGEQCVIRRQFAPELEDSPCWMEASVVCQFFL